MKNLLKKFAVMMAAVMLAMTTFVMPTAPSFAADNTVLKIMNLPEDGVDVKAYKVVRQKADGSWESINTDGTWGDGEGKVKAIADVSKPKSSEITDLATKTLKESRVKFEANSAWTDGDTDAAKATQFWSADMKDDANKKYGTDDDDGAGMYLVTVSTSGDAKGLVRVYNPMIVSLAPDQETGDLAGGTVDSKSNFAGGSTANIAYAKSSEPTFDKYITRNRTEGSEKDNDKANHNKGNAEIDGTTNVLNDKTTNESEKGDTANKGDTVWFEINTSIPVYADNYTNPTFVIHDQLSEGLDLDRSSIKVLVGGTELDSSKYSISYVPTANVNPLGTGTKAANVKEKFDITFTSDYLKEKQGVLPQKDVVVKYNAVVRNDCDENFDPETNEAYITYTHKPGANKDSENKKTYHYTFSINGHINGEGSTLLREVVKVGVNKDDVWVYEETQKANNGWVEDIEGATFNLYRADQMDKTTEPTAPKASEKEKAIRTAYSAADGRLVGGTYDGETYTGLDRLDAGVYYLVEQSVPSPYKVNSLPIKVEITSNLNADGTLDSYKIQVNEVTAGEYKAVYGTGVDAEGEPQITGYQIKDGSEWTTSKTAAQAVDSVTGTAPVKPVKADYDNAPDKKIDGRTYQQALNDWFTACKNYFAANDPDSEAADIANNKTGTLPSTGGMGTIMFTIGGIVIMALALFLLFGSRRKQHQK